MTTSKAFTATGRFGICVPAAARPVFTKKEMDGSGVRHTLFLTNPRWLAVAGLLFHTCLQIGFYKHYSSLFPGLG